MLDMNRSTMTFSSWFDELVFLFMKNKQGVPDQEHSKWHWQVGYSPAEAYRKMMADKTWDDDSDDDIDLDDGPSGPQQSR